MSERTVENDAPYESLRRQVEKVEGANRRAGYSVPDGALICLPYPEARALLNYALPPAGCACGHGWEYHGPEPPGCVECRCRVIPSATNKGPSA